VRRVDVQVEAVFAAISRRAQVGRVLDAGGGGLLASRTLFHGDGGTGLLIFASH
jgi:hypothetical protein